MLICKYIVKHYVTGAETTQTWKEPVNNDLEALDVKIRLEKMYAFSEKYDLVGFYTEETKKGE